MKWNKRNNQPRLTSYIIYWTLLKEETTSLEKKKAKNKPVKTWKIKIKPKNLPKFQTKLIEEFIGNLIKELLNIIKIITKFLASSELYF